MHLSILDFQKLCLLDGHVFQDISSKQIWEMSKDMTYCFLMMLLFCGLQVSHN